MKVALTALEVKAFLDEGEVVHFIDIRPPVDFELVRIPGAINIPKDKLFDSLDQLPQEGKKIVYCRFGIKSTQIVRSLREEYGVQDVYALRDGLLEWAIDIDPDMPKDLI
jgi:adenylyltransferase/sulfurtransferase